MDFRLTISAETLRLAPDLKKAATDDGLLVIKNSSARTYLRVTPAQWTLLSLFEEPRMVPAVLDRAIRDRLCIPLGEFYELILKAVREKILLPPGDLPPAVIPMAWRGSMNPAAMARPLGVGFFAGLVLCLAFPPALPANAFDVAMGAVILSTAASLAAYLTGCLLRGAGVEVYRPRRWWWPAFRIDSTDARLLTGRAYNAVTIAEPAVLALAAGLTTCYRPEWTFIPVLGLVLNIRPFFGAKFAGLIKIGHEARLSDAAHAFIFPPNRGPKARWRLVRVALREINTWVRLGYGVVWTLAVIYLAGRFTNQPPWTPEFWDANGATIGIAIGSSLGALAVGYIIWEMGLLLRSGSRASAGGLQRWRSRWFSDEKPLLNETRRIQAMSESPLLRLLDTAQRLTLAQTMEPAAYGPWRRLNAYEGEGPPRIALIATGKVAVHREQAKGKRALVQVLGPGDVMGLHDVADPQRKSYQFRTRSRVTLLTADRARTTELLLGRTTYSPFGNSVLKVPFLRGIPLCRNWHSQAIERFALLSAVCEYPDGKTIFEEGQMVDRFFIILEGEAHICAGSRRIAIIRAGDFFGEIGLLQNSTASASVVAARDVRCLAIARGDFVRFVTHNYAVALELERTSSKRLGRPIFPVRQSDFRAR